MGWVDPRVGFGWVGLGMGRKFVLLVGWVGSWGSEMAYVRKIHVMYICIFVSTVEYRLANSFCENLQLVHHCFISSVGNRPNMTVMLVILWVFALLRCALG